MSKSNFRAKKDWAPEKASTMELTEPYLENLDSASHTDPIGPDDVLKISLRAAAEARERLQAKYPKPCRMGYLTFDNSSTTYNTIKDGSGNQFSTEIYPLKIESTPEDKHDIIE